MTQASLGSVLQSKKENSGAKGGHWFPYDPLRQHACLSGMFDIDLYANELVSAQKTNSLTTIDLVHLQSAAKQSTPLALKFRNFKLGRLLSLPCNSKSSSTLLGEVRGWKTFSVEVLLKSRKPPERTFWEKCPNYLYYRL